MNRIKNMRDKHETQETLQKKPVVNSVLPLLKVKSGVKSGFEYNIHISSEQLSKSFNNLKNSVQSIIPDWT